MTVHDRSTSKNTKCEMRLALTVKRFIPKTYVYAAPVLTKFPHPLGGEGVNMLTLWVGIFISAENDRTILDKGG